MRVFSVLLLASFLLSVASSTASYPPPPPSCSGPHAGRGGTNCSAEKPAQILVDKSEPVFVSAVKNGKRYRAGSGNDTFHIAHLYSDTDDLYEMGFALGQLFPNEMKEMFAKIEPWLAERLEKAVPWLPEWLANLVVDLGVPLAIDLVAEITIDYIPKDYLEEWKGIAAGANCSVMDIVRVSLFPQLSKAACTALVAHENATVGGAVQQLRALDFDPLSYVSDFAAVIIYHYKNKPQLANFGWVAMTGVLTGMNDVPITVGEKAWGGHSAWLGLPEGLPWMQMVRRSLEMRNLTAVEAYINASDKATWYDPGNSVSIHLAYGDGASNHVIGYEVGYNYSQSFHWNTHGESPTHPLFPGIVYWTKNDPAHTMCPADMLTAQYGKIDAEFLAMYYSPNDMTGDTQMVGFDLGNMKVWVANSRKSTSNGPLCAYYRQRTVLDMKKLFAEKQN